MPLRVSRPELFPDDTNPLPASGSREQAALLDDELEIGNEGYLERLQQLSDITDNIYPELLSAIRNAVGQALPGKRLRFLDLCSGVGVVTLQLIEAAIPIETVTLADLSPELLRRAGVILAKRIGESRMPPLDTIALDLLVEDLRQRTPGGYDLVVTCNAFQHFPRERQAELFRQIHGILGPSGVFVFESHFKPIRPDWKQNLIDEYQAKLRRTGAPAQFILDAADHINNFHNYVNLREGYEWLEAAEFGFYECVFRKDEIGIFVAVK
jgi:SAM-dependent methyltransferase